MAQSLYLQVGDAGASANLLTGTLKNPTTWLTRGAHPAAAWQQSPYGAQYTFQYYPPLTEIFDLVAKDSAANIRTAIKAIEAILETARLWHAGQTKDPVWLVAASNGETIRRALVYDGSISLAGQASSVPLLEKPALNATLILDRHPLWEPATANTQINAQILNCLGGQYAAAVGPSSAPHRIYYAALTPYVTTAVSRFWLGFRETSNGTTGITFLWELEDGDISDPTYTTLTTEVGASPYGSVANNRLTVGYNVLDTTNLKRVTIGVKDIPGITAAANMPGRYLVILRAKVLANTNVVFQLRYGYSGSTDAMHRISNTIYYAGTGAAYRLIELGNISIPASPYYAAPTALNNKAYTTDLQLWIQRVDGTDDVQLDCLILIPCDHIIHVDDLDDINLNDKCYIVTTPDERTLANRYKLTGGVFHVGEITTQPSPDFYWPGAGAIAVFAAERSASSILDDYAYLSMYTFSRWHTYS